LRWIRWPGFIKNHKIVESFAGTMYNN